jgi:NDP-sugar pyrophosphorylase family protein
MSSKNSLFAFNNVIIIHLSCLSRHITKNKSSGSRTDLYMNSICTQTRLNTQIYRYRFNRFYMPHKKRLACNILLFGRTLCIFKRCVKLGKVRIFKRCVARKGVYIQKVCKIGKGVYIQKVCSIERCVYSKGV